MLRFGDRVFYRDWWNANTIEAYWRLWNLPVHYWMVSARSEQTILFCRLCGISELVFRVPLCLHGLVKFSWHRNLALLQALEMDPSVIQKVTEGVVGIRELIISTKTLDWCHIPGTRWAWIVLYTVLGFEKRSVSTGVALHWSSLASE